jgi:hypothetical protein
MVLVGLLVPGMPAGTALAQPDGGPAQGAASNMGLRSAFLAQLGVRDDVNHLLKEIGPFLPDVPSDSPGELYRIRAGQHPDAPAAVECVQRPPTN